MSDCKSATIEKNDTIIPAYEIICPYCNSKLMFEIELVKHCSALFCDYCRQEVEIFKKEKRKN